jgi:hypothetical protein
MLGYQISTGVGVWAYAPEMWAGHHQLRLVDRYRHAGTLISAILFFASAGARGESRGGSHDDFRRHVRRNFPAVHVGRVSTTVALPDPELVQSMAAIPLAAHVDVFAVSTYFTVSVLFCKSV